MFAASSDKVVVIVIFIIYFNLVFCASIVCVNWNDYYQVHSYSFYQDLSEIFLSFNDHTAISGFLIMMQSAD